VVAAEPDVARFVPGHGLNRLRKNSAMPALPWKSGASAPRKAFRIVRTSARVVAFRAPK
jgi:hypothetical protein